MTQTQPSNPEDAIRVLHVDDERGQLKFTKSFVELSDSTIHMESVATPEAALRRLEEENFDCIVSDYQMPVLNGIELARRIRGFSDVPIIIYTGRGSEEVASKAFAAGIDDYMRKEIEPSHYEVLARRIRAAVEKHLYERRLGKSVNQFRVLFDGIPDAILLIDPQDYTIIRANKAAFEHPWKEEVDVIGRPCYEITHQRSSPCEPLDHKCPIRELLETGMSTTEVHLHHDKDGNEVYQEVSVFPVLDDEGRIVNVVHCSRNITAKLRMEMDLILVNRLNEAVNRGDSLQKIFGLLAKETGKNFSSFGSSVYLVSENGEHLVLQNQTLPQPLLSSIEKLIGRSIPKVEIPLKPGSLYSEILGLNSPQLIQEPESIRRLIVECTENVVLKRLTPQIYSALGIRSVIVAPLVSEGETIGLLDISRRKTFRASDLERIKHIASQVATIIKRKQIEEDLLLERDKAQRYLDVASEILVALDAEGKVTLLNRSGCELLGWTKDEAVGRDWFESFIPERIRDDVKPVFGKLLSRDLGPVEYYENPILTINGEERLIDWHNTLLQDPAGKITGILSSGIDITERKKREEELRRTEERYRTLIEAGMDAVAITMEQEFVYVNKTFVEMLGYADPSELIGRRSSELVDPRDRERLEELTERRKRGENQRIIYGLRLLKKDGSLIWVEVSSIGTEFEGKRATISNSRDITDRKRMEEEIRRSEETYQSLLESLMDAVVVYDRERCLYANTKAAELLGYEDPSSLVGRHFVEFFAPEYIELVTRRSRERLAGGSPPSRYSFTMLRADSSPVEVEANINVVNYQGKPAILAVARDITERKRSEAALKALHGHASELALAETMIEVAEVTFKTIEQVLGFDIGGFGVVEGSLLRLILVRGVEAEEPFEMPLDGPGVMVRVIKTGETQLIPDTRLDEDFVLGLAEGVYCPLSELAVPVKVDGEFVAAINIESVNLDAFTEEDKNLLEILAEHVASALGRLRRVETLESLVEEKTMELSVSEERLRSFTASAPDAFTLYDSELNCLDVNEALLKYWPEGTRKEDLIGKNILDLSPYIKETGRYDRYLEVIKTGKPFQIEDPTAHPFLGDARLSLRAFKVGEGLGIITTDITNQKRMEEQLVEAERMSAMGRVSAMVGHDLRGPLQTIMNALYMMEKTPEQTGELRGKIKDSVNYATRILDDLRYSTGDIPIHLQETNVGALLQKIITSSTVPDNIRVDLDVGEGLTSVRLDPLMAQRVLDNLVRNSVEAMADGGVLSLSAFKESDWVVIRVSDTGTGITEEDLKHIFTLFFTSKPGGTGLGLAYCKRAVEAHGGTITVESEVGRGATFTVRIPMRDE